MDLQPVIAIVVGLIIIGIIWKVITGIIRLVLTVGLIGIILYFVWPYLVGS